MKILVAEDNAINQLLIKKLLASIGYRTVTVVENGQLAVEEMKKSSYSVILMDIMVLKLI